MQGKACVLFSFSRREGQGLEKSSVDRYHFQWLLTPLPGVV